MRFVNATVYALCIYKCIATVTSHGVHVLMWLNTVCLRTAAQLLRRKVEPVLRSLISKTMRLSHGARLGLSLEAVFLLRNGHEQLLRACTLAHYMCAETSKLKVL